MLSITKPNGNIIRYPTWGKSCMFNTPDVVKVNKLIQVSIGQGEGDTRWNGCPWNWPLSIFNIDHLYIIYETEHETINCKNGSPVTQVNHTLDNFYHK